MTPWWISRLRNINCIPGCKPGFSPLPLWTWLQPCSSIVLPPVLSCLWPGRNHMCLSHWSKPSCRPGYRSRDSNINQGICWEPHVPMAPISRLSTTDLTTWTQKHTHRPSWPSYSPACLLSWRQPYVPTDTTGATTNHTSRSRSTVSGSPRGSFVPSHPSESSFRPPLDLAPALPDSKHGSHHSQLHRNKPATETSSGLLLDITSQPAQNPCPSEIKVFIY